MELRINDTVYRVHFEHHPPERRVVPIGAFRDVYVVPGRTVAHISDGEKQLLSRGVALCHINDPWRPSVGRKIALTRAIVGLPEGKEKAFRRAFWQALFEAKRAGGGKRIRP